MGRFYRKEPQTLVLNPVQLEDTLKNFPARLEQKDIGFIANRLELLAREGTILSPRKARAKNL